VRPSLEWTFSRNTPFLHLRTGVVPSRNSQNGKEVWQMPKPITMNFGRWLCTLWRAKSSRPRSTQNQFRAKERHSVVMGACQSLARKQRVRPLFPQTTASLSTLVHRAKPRKARKRGFGHCNVSSAHGCSQRVNVFSFQAYLLLLEAWRLLAAA
jgi:hypothetical protein